MVERTPQELTLLERVTDPLLDTLPPRANIALGIAAGMAAELIGKAAAPVRKIGHGVLDVTHRKHFDSPEL